MKITVEFYDKTITIQSKYDDMTASAFIDEMVIPAMKAMEYADGSIQSGLDTANVV